MLLLAHVRPYAWAGATAVSSISSKYLLISSNYHYPFYLLTFQLLVAGIMLTCLSLIEQTPSTVSAKFLLRLKPAVIFQKLSDNRKLLLSTVCLAAFFPLWAQAMLHFENPVALLMLMPLVTMIGDFPLHHHQAKRTSKWFKSRTGLILLACFCVMFDDYRLTPNGLVFGILSLLTLASAGLLYYTHVRQSDVYETAVTQIYTLPSIFLPFGIAAVCYGLSDKAVTSVANPDQRGMLCVNVVSSATSYVLGFQMLGHNIASWIAEYTVFVLVGLAAFMSRMLGVASYLSWLQLVAFGAAILCTSEQLFASTNYDTYDRVVDSGDYLELVDIAGSETDSVCIEHPPESAGQENIQLPLGSGNNALWIADVILLALTGAIWIFSLWQNFSSSFIDVASSIEPRLDRGYKPVSELDVVVSMFKEPPSAIKSTFDRLKGLPEIGRRNPRLVVYTKDPSANIDLLMKQTGATSVVQLPNVGREGHTYLHHVIEQWQDLAAQTFFLQADIHNPREFFPRVRDYYTSQTGMLSLGFSGQTCNCRDCGDRFGWWDNTLVGEVWSQAMNETCTDQQMLLSYKGQFVASAARLRGNEQSLYKTLRTALEDPENFVHQEDYLQGRPDSMNAPFFGYTLERLWSVLLQCSEERIATRCPTLLSGTRRGGSKEDCQCLDVY